ncbi:hypothetical protein ZYGM_001909, partial [Zygosaccharomyces mellis]
MLFALQLLVGCFSAALALSSASDRSFFTSVELRDALSGNSYSFDPKHWFLMEAEMFISEGQTEELSLQVPNEFVALPETPFSLLHHSEEVGKVVNNNNVMTVSFPEPPANNATATFNFLSKLSEDAIEELQSPRDVEYTFTTSKGDSFQQVMHYEPKSLDKVTANGGIYGNNKTAWFTVDVPVDQLDRPVYITSESKMGASEYNIDTSKTKCELVKKVDDFNEPLESVPFSPEDDTSSVNSINMKFNNTGTEGGVYVRITYYTLPLYHGSVGNQVSFHKGSLSSIFRRNFKKDLEFDVFADSHVNLFPRDEITEVAPNPGTYSNSSTSSSRMYSVPSSLLSASSTPSGVSAGLSSMSSAPSVTFASPSDASTVPAASTENSTPSQPLNSSGISSSSEPTSAVSTSSSGASDLSSVVSATSANSTSVPPTSGSSTASTGVSAASNTTSSPISTLSSSGSESTT